MKGDIMKLLLWCALLTMGIQGMDKLRNIVERSPRDEKKEEKSKAEKTSKSPREDKKEKDRKDNVSHEPHKAGATRRDSIFEPRTSKSESPLRQSHANTVGKRASLDWADALKDIAKHTHEEEAVKQWSQQDAQEEKLKKLFEEFSSASPERQKEIYCIVMKIPLVSVVKESLASNFFEMNQKIAASALYNIPNYYLVKNNEEARLGIKMFRQALYEAKEAYIHKLCAAAPKRDKFTCEAVVNRDPNSPILRLLAQFEALKQRFPEHQKDFELPLFTLPHKP